MAAFDDPVGCQYCPAPNVAIFSGPLLWLALRSRDVIDGAL